MRWTEIDQRIPARDWVESERHGASWQTLRAQTEALATHLAREVAGLPTAPIDREAARTAVGQAYAQAFMLFGFGARGTAATSKHWKGMLGLLAAALGDHDLVALCTGGRALGVKVIASKAFGANTRGLARHLGTASRARLPPSHVEAAMAELRAGFAADSLVDPRVALVAAHVFLHRIAGVADVPAACRAWLAGESLELPEGPAIQAVADGDDARATIFERYAAELSDETAVAHAYEFLRRPSRERAQDAKPFIHLWESHAATLLFVARRPLPDDWEGCVDPVIAHWLGGQIPRASLAKRHREQAAHARRLTAEGGLAEVSWLGRTDAAVLGLLTGEAALVTAMTGGKPLTAFKPGKFFKDDFHKLVRYLAAGAAAQATRADVEPALLDFLSRRSPMTNGALRGGSLGWLHLLALASVVYGERGAAPPGEVGRALQRAVTGV